MLAFLKKLFLENLLLKAISLVLALALWFYVVNELNKGSAEEKQLLRKILPAENMMARKLPIKSVFVGKVRAGFTFDKNKVVVSPDFCIVVGTRDVLEKVRFAYTMPMDISGMSKPFTRSVSLSPIAAGIFMEETLVQVTVPIERAADK
jgi:YbbR domain-containing protein